MTLKTLNVSLIAAGVLAVGTAGAIGLKPDLIKTADTAAVTTSAAAATTAAGGLAPAAPVPARSAVPDYRAIVAQAGPAVVGVTVEGSHKVSREEMPQLPPGAENDLDAWGRVVAAGAEMQRRLLGHVDRLHRQADHRCH